MKGTSTGKADVYLDGVFKKTVDLAGVVRGLSGGRYGRPASCPPASTT